MYSPDFETFRRLAADHDLVPVYRRLMSDALTPVTGLHKIDDGGSVCLFESVIGGEKVGRYSILAAGPFLELSARGSTVTIRSGGQCESFESADPLEELRRRLVNVKAAQLPGLPPFTGGAVGYAGYDVVRYTEHLPNAPADDRGLPDLSFAFYDRMLVFDNVSKTMFVVALARIDKTKNADTAADEAYRQAQRTVDQLVDKLSSPVDLPPADIVTSGEPRLDYTSNFTPADFEAAVGKCVEYIRAGDIFQVVISQRLAVPIQCDPFEIYRTLRVVNPSPFMFFLRTPEVTLVGSSPEILCRVVDRKVTVRPLAGTRRRGTTDEEDRRLADELLNDPKERAEHVMLVDLGRNDVGRVARFGSVQLSDVMVIERYSHVMHITSNVTGELAPGRDAFDALRACLPAGTVSGAPKVRAMQIIDELEPHRRGPYAGAVGYFDYGGNMDTCIALRTLVVQGNTAYIQAGAGIVADSVPALEYQETLNKARGLLKAIEITEHRYSQPVRISLKFAIGERREGPVMRINQYLESMNLRIAPLRIEWQGENDYVVVLKLWDKNIENRDTPKMRIHCLTPPSERPETSIRGHCWDHRLNAINAIRTGQKHGFFTIGFEGRRKQKTYEDFLEDRVYKVREIREGDDGALWVYFNWETVSPDEVRSLRMRPKKHSS